MTRDLEVAKSYLFDRYADAPDARYGLVASSRDKILERDWGVPNTWNSTKRLQLGPWYDEGDDDRRSCRRLEQCVTEFQAQGLELDAVLLAWGLDLIRGGADAPGDGGTGERWTDAHAKRHARGSHVRDPHQLRINAYRVLLTRGRDAAVVFVPPDWRLDATAEWLQGHGVKVLGRLSLCRPPKRPATIGSESRASPAKPSGLRCVYFVYVYTGVDVQAGRTPWKPA